MILSKEDNQNLWSLAIVLILLILLSIKIGSKKNKKQLDKIFIGTCILLMLWIIGLIFQILGAGIFRINPIYFDYFVYIPVCLMPVAMLLISIIFTKTKIKFKRKYLLLLIIPIITIIMLWTNNMHHLFYKQYSTNVSNTIYGPYMYVHLTYTYLLYAVALFILVKYSIKNSGFFSKSAISILIGASIPIIINVLGFLGVIQISIYTTPITFTITLICISLASFMFNLFGTTPIALQRIVDRISDSYVVLNEDYEISDFNQTFINTFKINQSVKLRGINLKQFIAEKKIDSEFLESFEKVKNNSDIESFETHIASIGKYFKVEVTPIIVNEQSLGTIILFKDITQHKHDIQTIERNQEILMENERLSSLGQLVGGITHNLKTPIMSISGAAEGLTDLVKELDASIGNPVVNDEDFHGIADDMKKWISKIKSYTEYMSDILTAVKGQAVTMSNEEEMSFTIVELLKRVDILMKHELKNAVVYLNVSMRVDENLSIKGNVNSLVQVVNNMISNAIQAYAGEQNQFIDLTVTEDKNNVIISIKDYGPGLPDKVKKKLFKEMITTKGKNGTGLGMYMSYSNIKAHFHGDITFESEEGKGTTFNIILPK